MAFYTFGHKQNTAELDLKSKCLKCNLYFYYSESEVLNLLHASPEYIKCPEGCILAFGHALKGSRILQKNR